MFGLKYQIEYILVEYIFLKTKYLKESSVGLKGLRKLDCTCHKGPARQSGTCYAAHLFVVVLDQSLASLE